MDTVTVNVLPRFLIPAIVIAFLSKARALQLNTAVPLSRRCAFIPVPKL